jgi:hypothetical protein
MPRTRLHPTRSKRGRTRHVFGNLLLLVISIILVCGILEVALSALHLVSDQFGAWDNTLWIHHIPNKTGYYVNGYGLQIPVRFNSDGFRGPEFGPKGNKTFRVLMLGDSFVASLGTLENETSSAFLTRYLAQDPFMKKAYAKVEVYNLGVSGYSFTTYDLLLNKTIEQYTPDVVVINPFLGNDVFQDNPKTDSESYPHAIIMPGASGQNQAIPGSTIQFSTPKKPFIYTWNEYLGWMFPRLQRFVFVKVTAATKAWHEKGPRNVTETDPINLYLKNNSAVIRETWNIIGVLLEDMNTQTAKHHAILIVVPFTQAEQLYADWRKAYLAPYPSVNAAMIDFEKPEQDLLTACAQANVSCYPTLAIVRDFVRRTNRSTIFPYDSHYATQGNDIHARIIADIIISKMNKDNP